MSSIKFNWVLINIIILHKLMYITIYYLYLSEKDITDIRKVYRLKNIKNLYIY